jgi:hypothetical protein
MINLSVQKKLIVPTRADLNRQPKSDAYLKLQVFILFLFTALKILLLDMYAKLMLESL